MNLLVRARHASAQHRLGRAQRRSEYAASIQGLPVFRVTEQALIVQVTAANAAQAPPGGGHTSEAGEAPVRLPRVFGCLAVVVGTRDSRPAVYQRGTGSSPVLRAG